MHALIYSLLASTNPQLPRSAILRNAAALSAFAAVPPLSAIPPPEMIAAAQKQAAAGPPPPQVLYTPPSIKGLSSPDQIALAEHLKKTGAKMYGAYWCSFCLRQRQMFGAGGSRNLPYVECAADGYQSATATCRSSGQVTGYPTWEINGKFYGGMRTLRDLQELSGFDPTVTFPEYVPPPPPPKPKPPPGGFKAPPIETVSGAKEVALARHLKETNAQFFGAYWCGYCNKQRQLFGAEATKALPYIECAADGYQSDSKSCAGKVQAYPTWQINGQFYGGMKSLDELARLSGFVEKKPPPALAVDMSSSGKGTVRGDPGCTLSDGEENCEKK